MSDSLRKFLEIAGIVVITLGLISILFIGLNKATGFADKMFAKMDAMSVTVDESDFTKYDGTLVSGADVIAAIKYFQNGMEPICIEVMGKTYIYTDETLQTPSDENINNASRKGAEGYINPNAKFLGEVSRDATDNSIRKITFTIQVNP